MNVILLAAPGAGKGTQAERLSKHYGIPSISTGVMLRKSIKEGTDFGKKAQQYIDKGQLVPDDLMIEVVGTRIGKEDCRNGFILDGFPRTITQAEALEESGINIDAVLTIEVPNEKIIERLTGRLECKSCGTTFHRIYRVPKVEGVCDNCGGALTVRADDRPETVKSRLDIYHRRTEPLKEFYKGRGKLRVAVGQEDIDDTTKEVLRAIAE